MMGAIIAMVKTRAKHKYVVIAVSSFTVDKNARHWIGHHIPGVVAEIGRRRLLYAS